MYLSLLFRGLAIPLDVDCVGGCALHTTRRVGILDGGRSDPLPPRFNESRTAVGFPATAGTGPLGHIEASRRTHRGGGGSSPRGVTVVECCQTTHPRFIIPLLLVTVTPCKVSTPSGSQRPIKSIKAVTAFVSECITCGLTPTVPIPQATLSLMPTPQSALRPPSRPPVHFQSIDRSSGSRRR